MTGSRSTNDSLPGDSPLHEANGSLVVHKPSIHPVSKHLCVCHAHRVELKTVADLAQEFMIRAHSSFDVGRCTGPSRHRSKSCAIHLLRRFVRTRTKRLGVDRKRGTMHAGQLRLIMPLDTPMGLPIALRRVKFATRNIFRF